MTAANWKTNEVHKPSLDSAVCVRETERVMRSRKKDGARGQPCQEQVLTKLLLHFLVLQVETL